jgi:hypothetical protein
MVIIYIYIYKEYSFPKDKRRKLSGPRRQRVIDDGVRSIGDLETNKMRRIE